MSPSGRRPYTRLTELDGVDEKTAKRLYEAGYQRLYHITSASQNTIQQIDGITPGLASHIKTQAEAVESEGGLSTEAASAGSETSTGQSGHETTGSPTSAPSTEAWPMPGGDPTRSYTRPNQRLADIDSEVEWEFPANVSSLSSPTLADGRLIFTGDGGIVMAVDGKSGTHVWSFEMEPDHSFSGSPAAVGETVYVHGDYEEGGGIIYALDISDGSVRWSYRTGAYPSAPVVVDDTVYTGSGNDIIALDTATGIVKWTTRTWGGRPVVSDKGVYVANGYDESSSVFALEPESGEVRWSTELDTHDAFTPILVDNTLYTGHISGDTGTIYELETVSGHVQQEVTTRGIESITGLSTPTVAHGTLYGKTRSLSDSKGAIYAIDLSTGAPKWSHEIGTGTRPVIIGDTVFIGVTDRESGTAAVYAFNAASGNIRWQQMCPGRVRSAPVVGDRHLYVPTGNMIQAINIDLRPASQSVDETARSASTSTEAAVPDELDATAWPMTRGDLARTGVHPNASPSIDTPTQRWFFDGHLNQLGGRVTVRTPTVVDGTAYVSIGPLVYAVDTTDGTAIWQFNTRATNPANTSMPTVHEGTVYVASSAQCLHALDAADGTEIWRFDTDENTVRSPVVVDDQVLFTQNAGVLHAIDTDTGTENWQFEVPSTGIARLDTPAVAGRTVYIPAKTTLYAVDVTDGTEQWRFEAGGATSFMPAVSDDTIYLGGERVVALDTTGNLKWSFSPDRWSTGSAPAVGSDAVYVGGQGYLGERGSDDRGVYALEPDRGEVQWYQETDTVNPPVVADGTVYVGEDGKNKNHIRALDADTGTERWNLNLYADSIASPAVADETVYVGCSDDGVYALGSR